MRRLPVLIALVASVLPFLAEGDCGHVVYARATVVADAADADGDGLADVTERILGTDPHVADTDGDGLLDGDEEISLGSSAHVADSDGDGFCDGLEVAAGADPLDVASFPVTVAGVVSNEVRDLSQGPLSVKLIPTSLGAAAFITNNAAAVQVCRKILLTSGFEAFVFTNAAACRTAFRIEAWRDVNTNGVFDAWEPCGTYVSAEGVASNVADVVVVLTADTLTDTDGNGLPDSWEWRHLGQVGADPLADPDEDGLDNLREYLLGTDPRNEDTDHDGMSDGQEVAVGFSPTVYDAPPELSILRDDRGYFRIMWNGRYSQGYQPKYTDGLISNGWFDLTPRPMYQYEKYPVGEMSVIDLNTNVLRRFYKLELVK